MTFSDFKNNVDFFLRNKFPFSRKNYRERNENKDSVLKNKKTFARFNSLREEFDLQYLENNSTKINFLENLYVLDILEKYFKIEFKDDISILDIGCRNWSYVKGEDAFFKRFCKQLEISGIELDFNRLYFNLFSRNEVAKYYMRGTNARYIQGDFLKLEGKFDYFTWFLPFIFENTQKSYGLPLKSFLPENMIIHAYDLLKEGGKIFIVNQGIIEYESQVAFCEQLAIPYKKIGKIESDFLQYKNERFAIVINK